MNMEEFWSIIINAFLFYLAFRIGQISILAKIGERERSEMQIKLEEVRKKGSRPVITVEEINGIFYAYDGNDFLAQGGTPDEIGKLIAQRYPNKYLLAKVEIKA
jgi:hypothetical protein